MNIIPIKSSTSVQKLNQRPYHLPPHPDDQLPLDLI